MFISLPSYSLADIYHHLPLSIFINQNLPSSTYILYFLKSHNTPLSPPPQKKNLHSHCFLFLLGHLHVPREIKYNHHAKFWGVNTMYYGICESREFTITYFHQYSLTNINCTIIYLPLYSLTNICHQLRVPLFIFISIHLPSSTFIHIH